MLSKIFDLFFGPAKSDQDKKPTKISKPITLDDMQEEIKRSQQFVPVPKEKLDQSGFALTGEALEQYKRAQEHDKSLLGKSVEDVQDSTIQTTLEQLKKGHDQALDLASKKAGSQDNQGERLVPRTIRINLTDEARDALKAKASESSADSTDTFKVKFKDLRHFILPSKSITVPENPVAQIVKEIARQNPHHLEGSKGEGWEKDDKQSNENNGDNAGSIEGADEESGGSADQKDAFLREKVKKLLEESRENESEDSDIEEKRPKDFYESIDEKSEHLKSAADTVAYYDFYDLKIAWKPIWSEVLGEVLNYESYGKIPRLVEEFLPEMTQMQWQNYRLRMEGLGGSWREVKIAAAQYALFEVFLYILNGGELEPSIEERLEVLSKKAKVDFSEVIELAKEHARQRITYEKLLAEGRNIEAQSFDFYIKRYIRRHQEKQSSLRSEWAGKLAVITSSGSPVQTVFGIHTENVGYEFPVFAPGSVNYGLLTTYRQKWKPLNWQVGDLVKTIPLAPKESRKYSKKLKITKKRSRKEIENSLASRRSEDSNNTRAESEIVERSNENTSFNQTVSGSGGFNIYGIAVDVNTSTGFNASAGGDSADTKKKFRESVAKSARDIKNERKVEVVEEDSREEDISTSSEISNPNEEITVTYLFYELQRRYEITEHLHGVDAVLLVANEVPSSEEITWGWIRDHDWILRRVMLDDSFLPALDYVLEGKKSMQATVNNLRKKKNKLQDILTSIKNRLKTLEGETAAGETNLQAYSQAIYSLTHQPDGFGFDLFRELHGLGAGSKIEAFEGKSEDTLERLDRIAQRLKGAKDEVAMQRSSLDQAVDDYNKAVQAKHYKMRSVQRLIQHIRGNILYYMQAIWNHEPSDQRYLRLFEQIVPFFEYPVDNEDVTVRVLSPDGTIDGLAEGTPFEVVLPPPGRTVEPQPRLDEIADLNNLLGFKGNYMIFPLRKQSYLTAYMMQSYMGGTLYKVSKDDGLSGKTLDSMLDPRKVDQGIPGIFARDPDAQSIRTSQYEEILNDLNTSVPVNKELKIKLEKLLREGKLRPEGEPEQIIVPTDSLYIEALPGKHALLEGFKLRHRKIDVEKAKAEHRAMVLDNVRAEARLWKLDFDDPEVDKSIRINSNAPVTFPVGGDSDNGSTGDSENP